MPPKKGGKKAKKSDSKKRLKKRESKKNVQAEEPPVSEEPTPEPPPPPPKPVREITIEDWIMERVSVTHLQAEDWNEEHKNTIGDFANDPSLRCLYFYKDIYRGFCVETEVPPFVISQMFYMSKVGTVEQLTKSNFLQHVQYGTVRGDYLTSLLRIMTKLHGPQFFKNPTWTESMRNDFAEKFHRFMSGLTDTRWKMEGKTVLYIPDEGTDIPVEVAAQNKEYVQRMEVCVIHWSRQIKHVLNLQTSVVGESESAGPQAEVEHWKNRCADLSGITSQLDNPAVTHISQILTLAKSNYISAFLKMAGEIQEGSRQAESNVKFLMVLKDPCQQLYESRPAEIPAMLPRFLNLIRMIWVNSEFYKTREIITGLLKKVSNQVIVQCCDSLNLDKMFEGCVTSTRKSIEECIGCCNQWMEIYHKTAATHQKFSPYEWKLSEVNFFSQIEAFIQRCKDLLEVCQALEHFARFEERNQKPLPQFWGQKGPQIVRGLTVIEQQFFRNLAILSKHRKSILDVKSSTWHEDYTRFCNGVKDLEVMTVNLINNAFNTVQTVEKGIEVLDVFMHLQSRELIRRCIEKRTVDVYNLFVAEMNTAKYIVSLKAKPPTFAHPKYAGAGHWARFLQNRLEKQMMALDRAFFLPPVPNTDDIRKEFHKVVVALEDYIRKTNYDWTMTIDTEVHLLLEYTLMEKSRVNPSMIDVNLKGPILKLFQELNYWWRLSFECPHYVSKMSRQASKLRTLRESVLLVVRDYNRIVGALNSEELGMFRERIRFVDKKLHPGLVKFHWTHTISDLFINECRMAASKVQAMVDEYKMTNHAIMQQCVRISELYLISIPVGKLFEDLSFVDEQIRHKESVTKQLKDCYTDIIRCLHRSHGVFSRDGSDVQDHWYRYTARVDAMMHEAFRLNIKRSLMFMSKAINGDNKSGPYPLFNVKVVLDNNKIEFSPRMNHLAVIMNNLWIECVEIFTNFARLPNLVANKSSVRPHHYVELGKCQETRKVHHAIIAGMQSCAQSLQTYLATWDNFKDIWEINKDAFIRRYQKLKPTVASFESDIARYTEVANNVQAYETVLNVQFVLLDSSPLKASIVAHCQEWQNKFTSLLLEMATTELHGLNSYLVDMGRKIVTPPRTLDEYAESLKLQEKLLSEKTSIHDRFEPLAEQFHVMGKYEVSVSQDDLLLHADLGNVWFRYQEQLLAAEEMLLQKRDYFKQSLMTQSEELKKDAQKTLEEFNTKGPFNADRSPQEALAVLADMRAMLNALKEQDALIRKGLGMFKIDHPVSKELQLLEKELDLIEGVWKLTLDWDTMYDNWKLTSFLDINTLDMEYESQNIYKKFVKYSKDLRDRCWEIVDNSKARVDQFRRTMPLVTDLKNKAMRQRHWDDIETMMDRTFDPETPEFTLEVIINFGFDAYANQINEISVAATKELAIENGLTNIKNTWTSCEYDMIPYKDKGHYKFRATDDIFSALEENQVALTTMKASRFVKPFAQDVDTWERQLSQVLEVTEMLLVVQRLWMYMENIFLGEDIRKQLPHESAMFDVVNGLWREITRRMNHTKIVLLCCTHAGQLEQLNDMNLKLEDIQKSLDSYLETKRQLFPRFYFLSNDDLLEILGQSKNPEAIQPHLKKCFDNIKSLKLTLVQNKRWEAAGMSSVEGEYVEFQAPFTLEGPVESWLSEVEKIMRWTLKEVLKNARAALKKQLTKRDKWIKDWPGQLCITSSQIQWTQDVTRALGQVKERGERRPLKHLKKKQVQMLDKFSEAIRGNLTKNQRYKIVALVTIEVHARDIIEKLYKTGCNDVNAFDWLSQLRLYWDKEYDDCIVRQTSTQFQYGYEYLGNSGRLVITPLTDRCYVTLTTALHLHRGGSPKGPAGTGKTETTKDLGKALGMYVIVVNCSDGLDYKSMGRMFSGLAQTGAWGCFDEFNRINIEVLSVVAQQILCILSALSENQERFVFEGRDISLVWSCGMFITMNPGYAGRTELPDNLKSMFRPIAMVVPDCNLICEILLFAEGFGNTKVLAKKVFTLYSLAIQQLSKQDHYDFALRAIVSVLRYSGKKKRANPNMSDEEVILLSMKDMNIPKLTSTDLPLFNGIMSDLFPGIETSTVDYSKLEDALTVELKERKLQVTKMALTKIIQLYETKLSRHSVMTVGGTQSAKTVGWRVLQSAMGHLNQEGDPNFQQVKDFPLNPKSVSLAELYGEFDLATSEWADGVLSCVMRQTCADEKPDEKWIVFDGPVDTLWIESMNSVMDDNKILTLINGERISMPEQVSLLFEVEDLAVASPATVSRCGMVFSDYRDMGWEPFVASWLNTFDDKEVVAILKLYFEKWVRKMLAFRKANCKDLVPIAELNGVASLCKLFTCLGTVEHGVDSNDTDNFAHTTELWFLFCMIWSVCASVDEDGRKKIDNIIREMEGSIPTKDTVYEYYIDPKIKSWVHWEEKLKGGWKYNPALPFYQQIVPTVDTVRYKFLMTTLIDSHTPILLVGPVGTGKTSVAIDSIGQLPHNRFTILSINMSARTSSNNVQDIIESRVEKRTKGVYVPIGSKKLITFMDDFNMPAKDTFGSQPPLELMRLWIDYGFWYNRKNQTTLKILDMFLVAAMGPPGGGRMVISRRLQSRFNLINMTFPQESQIKRIFGSMINQKLGEFEDEVKTIGDVLTEATIEMYYSITQKFLPTPAKIHYLFNLRDISRVFQGLLRAEKNRHDTREALTRLWTHECFRVFSDRLIDAKDKELFLVIMGEKLGSFFNQTLNNICPNKQPPLFGDYLNTDLLYEDITNIAALKKSMSTYLNEYNNSPGVVPMDLVLFRDAMEHVSKIVRVIRQPRGNMLLIGIGGSGRQSLSRLSSFICEYHAFQIEVTKHYKKMEFRDDLKKLYYQCGVENKPTVFLFNDIQVVEEGFLEDINNILSSGEVPNLFKPDELEDIKSTLSDICRKEGVEDNAQAVFAYLINRVRANLHVVLCMSPVGEDFRNRIRMYPAFVNCTTIDWFHRWPQDALLEVADRYLSDMDIGEDYEKHKPSLAQIFSVMQKSVADYSKRLLHELKRYNYVTPTNYLELVSGFKNLYFEKRGELSHEANKLSNGLSKIDDTREKVEKMSVELEDAKVKVVDFQRQCDEYLLVLVQQKHEADEQQKAVTVTSARIREESKKCKDMADAAQADLDLAMPALNAAVEALESLNKKDMTEIKSYGRPPPLVEKVMNAVMILRHAEPSWAEAKKQLGDSNFLAQLMNFDKDNISDKVLKRIGKFCDEAEFVPEVIGRVSTAAKSLCMWVRAMESYGRIYRIVEPKRQRLQKAMEALREKQQMLAEAQARLAELEAKIEELKKSYEEKLAQKEELKRKADHMELMMDRARRLVEGLAGERIRWMQTVEDLQKQISYLPGDCLIAAGFLSYMGPFVSQYRDDITGRVWMTQVKQLHIPHTPGLSFTDFMAKPTVVRDWNMQGLSSDAFSTENGIIVTRGMRWPLMVDPQSQAIRWIKNMEGSKGLKMIDFQQTDYMHTLETAIQMGLPVVLQNVQEKIDPSLDPVLNKSLVKVGGVDIMKLGDKEIEYNADFRFYITTRLSNPHYTPEISSKVAIVNFAVKLQGLEAQLLGIVVRKERPDLEETKDNLVRGIAAGKKKLLDLENEILRLLNEAKGSLLEDETLLNTLETSKVTSQEVTEQVATAETTEIKIDNARELYRPCALRAAILFFVLNDLGSVDPMYQFSLDTYNELFILSIEKSQKAHKLEDRIINLNDFHTYAVYRYTCRALFEKHKLLFSFHMCSKILERAGKLNKDEYNFLIRGGVVMDRESQMDNPCTSWLSETSWDNITELDKLTNFHDIVTSIEQYPRDWHHWYTSSTPETSVLPDVWENSCNELQRMLLVRSLRPDRVSFCVTSFITNNLGSAFVEPPVLNMTQVLDDSTCRTPLIFVLSPGVDPTGSLIQLADSKGFHDRFHALSLGQGQAPIATRYLIEGVKEGNWVFLANCHLSLSWMPSLDKVVEQLQTTEPHHDFRLWLSSSPHPEFPISILQQSIKITTEPPKGLKANMKRLYGNITEAQFGRCKSQDKYKRLLFCLCFFHSVLLERRKFLMLGWNIAYEFNNSDFEVSESLLNLYLDTYEDTPWDALKYLVAGINYGGHVTDDWDRRLLMTYMADYFNERILTESMAKLSTLPTYHVPKDGGLHIYYEYVCLLPNIDQPEVFGQHPNADIASQIQETRLLFDTLTSLAPQLVSAAGDSNEDKVLELGAAIFKQIPENIDYETTMQVLAVDPCPLNVVLLQEIQRYNILLNDIRSSLIDLEKGIQGLVVMTMDLEIVFHSLLDGRVPPAWEKAYNSMKPLGAWTRDLVQRVDQLYQWATTSHPPMIFWMSGFTFPTGFLTAVLQTYARSNKVSVDVLQWDFSVLTISDANVTGPPKDGVYIKGMYLQGAGWDQKMAVLKEADPMQLVCSMPSIHFRPSESRKKGSKGVYTCPCYYYPNRAGGSGRPSFVVAVDLKAGDRPPEHWIKRGTALLMSLDY